MSAIPKRRLTPAEYLALERAAEFRSEFFNGEMFAMAGTSLPHTRIVRNLTVCVENALQDSPCESLSTEMRVHIPSTGLYTYPDFIIVCEPPELEDDHFDTLLNPKVIVEVLSKSTEAYDRGTKFDHYREIETLEEYVLVSQHKPHVQRFVKQANDSWLLTNFSNLDGDFEFESVSVRIAMRNIYHNVVFPVAPAIASEDSEAENPLPRPEDVK